MEFVLWSCVALMLFIIFKVLSYENSNGICDQEDYLRRFMEIKKIHPYYRLEQMRQWEKSVALLFEEKPVDNANVIQFNSSKKAK